MQRHLLVAAVLATLSLLVSVMGIQPGDKLHELGTILEAVKQHVSVRAYPQIACSRAKNGLQLKEFRFCFKMLRAKPPPVFMDCPKRWDGKICKQPTDRVRLPPLPTEATYNDEL
ncbi:hypothetical protein QUC31_005921 [Theobroma cacao]